MSSSVFISIVTFNSATYISTCIRAALAQHGFEKGRDLIVQVVDNASTDKTLDILRKEFSSEVAIIANSENLGYCGGHNQSVKRFLQSECQFILFLNPDCRLEPNTIKTLVARHGNRMGLFTPKILRSDDALNATSPQVIDAAGMYLTLSLRHFDRGSEEVDYGQYDECRTVFGGTGACLMLSRECLKDLILPRGPFEEDLGLITKALLDNQAERTQLFDEAFFAYREDADLAWRAKRKGWQCLYIPEAIAYHRRVVLPERRADLDKKLNLYSVRNRFLLQLNNFSVRELPLHFFVGVVFRNLIVICGVLLFEQSSLVGLIQAWQLKKRALNMRSIFAAQG